MAATDGIVEAKLGAFVLHRANAARIAREHGGRFAYVPGHPHDVLDAADVAIREYLHEVNASIQALHEAGVASGAVDETERPELLEPYMCECCKKPVIPVPGDLRQGQPFGSRQTMVPLAGPVGARRREPIYDCEFRRRGVKW